MSNFELYQMYNALRPIAAKLTIAQYVNTAVSNYIHILSDQDNVCETTLSLLFIDPQYDVTYKLQMRKSRAKGILFTHWMDRYNTTYYSRAAPYVDAIKIGHLWIIVRGITQASDKCVTIDRHGITNYDADPRAILDILPVDVIKCIAAIPTLRPDQGIYFFPGDFPHSPMLQIPRHTVVDHCSHLYLSGDIHTLKVTNITDNVAQYVLLTLGVHEYAMFNKHFEQDEGNTSVWRDSIVAAEREKERLLDLLDADEYLTCLRTLAELGVELK